MRTPETPQCEATDQHELGGMFYYCQRPLGHGGRQHRFSCGHRYTSSRAPFVADAGEEWRDIPGWPWYMASSLGRLRSLYVPGTGYKARVLTPCLAGQFKAYLGVRLWNGNTNRGHTVNVQNLVAEAFLGPRPDGMEINHKNGVTTDNRIANLEYVTKRANEDHAVANRLHPDGERYHSAKLTEAAVREIRAVPYRERGSLKKLAAKYGVGRGVLTQVRMGKTWRHVKTTVEES